MKHTGRTWGGTLLRGLALAAALGALAWLVLLGIVLSGEHSRLKPPEEGGYTAMIILGCKVEGNGQPSVLLRDRLETALPFLLEDESLPVVVSGGQGANEPVSEAACMRDYLVDAGVAPERILLEDRSTSTEENLRMSRAVLQEHGFDLQGDYLVVSNGFHLARTRMLWGDVGRIYTAAAPASHAPSRFKMHLREPLALAKSWLLD